MLLPNKEGKAFFWTQLHYFFLLLIISRALNDTLRALSVTIIFFFVLSSQCNFVLPIARISAPFAKAWCRASTST